MRELATILAAISQGAGGTGEVARRTGLSPDRVEAGIATLAAAGRIRRVLVFAGGCAPTGCTTCGSRGGCGSAGVGSLVGSGLTAWRVMPTAGGPAGPATGPATGSGPAPRSSAGA